MLSGELEKQFAELILNNCYIARQMNSNNETCLDYIYALTLMAMLSAGCESVKINGFDISYTAILVHNCAPDNGDGTNGSVMIDMPLCETPDLIRTIHPAF